MLAQFMFYNNLINLFFDNINVFYGYNDSGKTLTAQTLLNGFLNNDDSLFLINNLKVNKNKYDVFFINSNDSLMNQLKFNSKSVLKKILISEVENIINSYDLVELLENIFEKINKNLKDINFLNSDITIKLDNYSIDNIIDSFLNVYIDDSHLSESNQIMILYNIFFKYTNICDKQSIIIIDDFDLFFDEQNVLNFFNTISKMKNTIFFLFTSKPYSLQYIINKYNIFCIRNKFIYDLSNSVNLFINNDNDCNHYSYEEHMMRLSISTSNEYNYFINLIKNNSLINLGRILVNKNYSINNLKDNCISIFSENNYELMFLYFIDKIINSH